MKNLSACAVVIVLCVSCAPPFDAGYSASAVITSKMTKESQLGPLYNYNTGFYVADPTFFPEKTASGVDTSRGFYLTQDNGGSIAALGFVQPNGSGGYASFDMWTTNLLPSPFGTLYHADPNYPLMTVIPVKSGDTAAFTYFDPSCTVNIQFEQPVFASNGFLSISTLTVGFSSLNLGVMSAPQVLGTFVSPTPSSTDTNYFLVQDTPNPTNTFYEAHATFDGVSGFNVPVQTVLSAVLDFFPAATTRVLYYRDPVNAVSYASFNSSGAWQCWKWWTDAEGVFHEAQLTGVTSRIDMLLTTGELFSTQDGIGRVYDANGTQITKFPLGKLKLSYEEYVNGTPRVFFSMSIAENQDHISLAVYSIASSQLDSLKY